MLNDVAGLQAIVRVYSVPTGGTPVADSGYKAYSNAGLVSATVSTAALQPNTQYYWAATCKNSSGVESAEASPRLGFTVVKVPAQPTASGPGSLIPGSTVDIPTGGLVLSMTFSNTPVTVTTFAVHLKDTNTGIENYASAGNNTFGATSGNVTVPASTFVDGHTYSWYCTAYAGTQASANSYTLTFVAHVATNKTPQIVTLNASTTTPTVGQAVTLTASGGSTSYTWSVPSGVTGYTAGAASQTLTFSAASSYTISVYAQSSSSYAQSNTASVTVNVGPAQLQQQAQVSLTPGSLSTPANTTLHFTASGGNGTGAFVWGGAAQGKPNGPSVDITFTQANTSPTVTVYRQGDSTYADSQPVSVTINVGPASLSNQPAVTVSPSTPTTTVGQPITLTASGGAGTGYYIWGGAAQGQPNGSSVTLTFTNASSQMVTVYRGGDANYNASDITTVGVTVNPAYVFGVDVSSIGQGSVTWSNVPSQPISYNGSTYPVTFAYVRATQGTDTDPPAQFKDPSFSTNVKVPANMRVGAYHVAAVYNTETGARYAAADEAAFFLKVAGQQIRDGNLRPMLDVENGSKTRPAHDGLPYLAKWVNDWMIAVHQATNVWPIIYGSDIAVPLGSEKLQSGKTVGQTYDLWLATYSEQPGKIEAPAGWSTPVLIQYSQTLEIKGIGVVDHDVCQQDFIARLVIPAGTTPQTFFGTFVKPASASGIHALATALSTNIAVSVNSGGTYGALVGFIPSLNAGVSVNFAISNGTFNASTKTIVASGGNPQILTITGTVANGVISGTIAEIGASFSATVDPQTGSTASIAGLYQSAGANNAATYSVVGTQGNVFVLAVTGSGVSAGTGAVYADNSFNVQASMGSNATIAGTIDPSSSAMSSTIATTSGTASVSGVYVMSSPVITSQPTDQTVAAGGPIALSVGAAGPGLTYQWTLAGHAIAGATASSYNVARATSADAGSYNVSVLNAAGIATSTTANVTVLAPSARLVNLSFRAPADGANVVIVGFAVSGSSKRVLIRGVGPGLTPFGVSDALQLPLLTMYDAHNQAIAANAGWGGSAALASTFKEVGAFDLASNSTDCALIQTAPPGISTAIVSSVAGKAGTTLAEIYDDEPTTAARLVNISGRAAVTVPNGNNLTAGFAVRGTGNEKLLVRAVGPGLAPLGLTGVLSTPIVVLYDGSAVPIATNAGWSNPPSLGASTVVATVTKASADDMASVGAFPISPGTADCAMVVTLPEGNYSAVVNGLNGTTGTGIVEIYEMPK